MPFNIVFFEASKLVSTKTLLLKHYYCRQGKFKTFTRNSLKNFFRGDFEGAKHPSKVTEMILRELFSQSNRVRWYMETILLEPRPLRMALCPCIGCEALHVTVGRTSGVMK